MLNFILQKIIGTHNERALKKIGPVVEKVNLLEAETAKLSDEQLKAKTEQFKKELADSTAEVKGRLEAVEKKLHEASLAERNTLDIELDKLKKELLMKREQFLDEILPEAFAIVREAAKRAIGLRHHDCQLIGGYVIHKANIAEMANGEGKTLVATLPAYLNALCQEGVHIVTTNDYLAKRDREWMGPVYEFLGLSVGAIQHEMNPQQKQEAYSCDITYGTNNEFGFDYLRDNMAISKEQLMQRGFYFAVVDEVDSILIDEARTPLIISGPAEQSTDKYYQIDKIIPRLKEGALNEETKEESGDFIVDEKSKNCYLTEQGEVKAAGLLGLDDMHSPETMDYKQHITQALRAHNLFKRDRDYVVKEGQVMIVDDFTGRLMPGRRWSDGLHQAIEAKENLKIERENQTLASVTFQNFFRMYTKLAGMSGTAATEANEFSHIYKLDVISIPTNKPLERKDEADQIYRSQREKFNAICDEVARQYNEGRPVLVGTISIEKSEKLSSLLKRRNIPHEVLNAKFHEKEAHIVAQAGKHKAVTIATNMAGRGTDIKLGGNAEYMAEDILRSDNIDAHSEEYKRKKEELLNNLTKDVEAERKKVMELGGLCVLGTERHESRRIDNQLRGRAGRQGVPGLSRFYLSLEDDLMRLFGSDRIALIMDKMGMEEGQVIQHTFITSAIERAQRKVEAYNFDIRKQLLEYDDVMNQQREIIYQQRRLVLEGDNLKVHILGMLDDLINEKVDFHMPPAVLPEQWDYKGLREWMWSKFGVDILGLEQKDLTQPKVKEHLYNLLKGVYDSKEQRIGTDKMRRLEKIVMLQTVDARWKDHLYAMDDLRGGIGLRAYGQRNPLIEYKNEGFNMFNAMIENIKEEVSEFIFKVQVVEDKAARAVFNALPQNMQHSELGQFSQRPPAPKRQAPAGREERNIAGATQPPPSGQKPQTYKRETPKVGRNDPCPCGSGKKYKKCCGR